MENYINVLLRLKYHTLLTHISEHIYYLMKIKSKSFNISM